MIDRSLKPIQFDQQTYTLREVCERTHAPENYVIELIRYGIIEPDSSRSVSDTRKYFSHVAVSRIQSARRLQKDLELNLAGVALALDLIEQNRALLDRAHFLERLISRIQ